MFGYGAFPKVRRLSTTSASRALVPPAKKQRRGPGPAPSLDVTL
jgi:hypothetical protein